MIYLDRAPTLVEFHRDRSTFPLRRGLVVRSSPYPGTEFRPSAVWHPIDHGGIALDWGTGFAGFTVAFARSGAGYAGTALTYTDVEGVPRRVVRRLTGTCPLRPGRCRTAVAADRAALPRARRSPRASLYAPGRHRPPRDATSAVRAAWRSSGTMGVAADASRGDPRWRSIPQLTATSATGDCRDMGHGMGARRRGGARALTLSFMIAGGSGAACNGDDGDNQIAAETRSAITISAPVGLKPRAPDSVAGDQFGWSLSVSGNTAVISANTSVQGIAGGVFVFQKANDAWSQVAKLAIPDDSPATDWGYVVATDGARIAVTSLSGDGTGSSGGIYTFVGSGSSWTFEERIPPPQSDFAEKLAVSGDTLVASNVGQVWVYVRSNGHWTAQSLRRRDRRRSLSAMELRSTEIAWRSARRSKTSTACSKRARFTSSIASHRRGRHPRVSPRPIPWCPTISVRRWRSRETRSAGAFFNAGGGSPAPFRNGRTLVFVKQGSAWQSISFPGLDSTAGESVAMSGRRIVFGSQGEVSDTIGAVHILERTNGVWAEAQNLKSTSTLDIDFGWRLGLMPDGLIVGCPTFSQNVAGNPTPGTAYAYGLNRLLGETGDACASSTDCETGFCADGVCCATACGGGVTNDCQACSLAAGGTQNGVCTAISATAAGTVRAVLLPGRATSPRFASLETRPAPAIRTRSTEPTATTVWFATASASARRERVGRECCLPAPTMTIPARRRRAPSPAAAVRPRSPVAPRPPRDAGSDASDTHSGSGGTGADGSGAGGTGAGGTGAGGTGAGGTGVGGGGAGGSGIDGSSPADAGGDISSHDGCSCATSGAVPRPLSTAGF